MIPKEISNQVLTIGNQSENPDGGISYVLYCYRNYVFESFHNIVNFRRGNFLYKLLIAVWAYIRELFVLLFNRRIKIVHVHTASGIAFKRSSYYIYLAHALGKKVVLHIHSGRFNEYWQENKEYVEKVVSKCFCVVALSEDLKNFYETQGCRIAVVVNNIIVPPTRQKPELSDGKVHLLFLGVITKTKGIYDLLEVIHDHQAEFEGKLMLHVGGNSEVDILLRMIDEKGLHNLVKFEGWLSGEAKNKALNRCDVFILPSYTEGVPISILEALSYGKYIVSTKVGGIPGVVDEKSGVLIPPQDKDCLYRALKDLIEKKEYQNNVSYRIEKSSDYMPETVSQQLESLYKEILSGHVVGGGVRSKECERVLVPANISRRVVMTGVYYKKNHPGGISAVVQYWSKYIDGLLYYPTFKEGSKITKIAVYLKSLIAIRFKLLTDKNVKILHAHTAAGTDFKRTSVIVNLAKKKGLKVVLHSHASSFKDFYADADEKQKAWIRCILNKAEVLIALSESWKQYFAGIGVPEEKIVILHNIAAYPQIRDVAKHEGKVRLLFMGEIGQRKGVFDLLRAIGNHKEEFKDKIELRIGGNKMEDKLRATISNYGIGDFVHFEGFVSGEKKIELLNWANVYVLPSFNEGLPISILEAMSYKMPIISTPVGGIPEVVNNSNGVLVTPGNDEDIYKAIRKYVDHYDLIEEHGASSFKKVETYMPDYVLNHLKRIYEGLLS